MYIFRIRNICHVPKYCGLYNSMCVSVELDVQVVHETVNTLLKHKNWFVQYVF